LVSLHSFQNLSRPLLTGFIAVDDADGIIRAFHRSIKLGKLVDLLPNMTEDENAALAKAEKRVDAPEKRALDDAVESDNKRARTGVVAA
jgi:homocitrate synthase